MTRFPSVPLQSWGYERYGTDLYTPAREAEADYNRYALSAKAVGDRLDKKGFRNNPEVNYQLRLLLESLGEFFPGSGSYGEKLQNLLTEAVTHTSSLGLVLCQYTVCHHCHAANGC